jgi:hypothetical protein
MKGNKITPWGLWQVGQDSICVRKQTRTAILQGNEALDVEMDRRERDRMRTSLSVICNLGISPVNTTTLAEIERKVWSSITLEGLAWCEHGIQSAGKAVGTWQGLTIPG